MYRPVWTPAGTELLFEVYSTYEPVRARAAELWRGIAGVTLTSLLVLCVLAVPILWRVFARLHTAQEQREALLLRAVDASTEERQRIAGSLHDGPVQDLVGTSFSLAGSASRAEALGDRTLAGELGRAGAGVRSSIGALRSLLVDLYPPGIATAGLSAALGDLAVQARARGLRVRLEVDEDAAQALPAHDQQLVHRVAQECLRNAARHAPGAEAVVTLATRGGTTVLDVRDDGPGFDAAAALASPEEGHFGVRVLGDVASAAGARLELAAAPGAGTHWRLTIGERA